jgi:amino acid transporter
MPLLQILVVLVVVGVLLWLVNLIPMQGTIKSILNAVVVIAVVLWLLNIFGLFHSLSHFRAGTQPPDHGADNMMPISLAGLCSYQGISYTSREDFWHRANPCHEKH